MRVKLEQISILNLQTDINSTFYTLSYPDHTKRSIGYSHRGRVRRICSEIEDFSKHMI